MSQLRKKSGSRARKGSPRNEARSSASPASRSGQPPSGAALNFLQYNNTMTASRLNCAGTCLRSHFWHYEISMRSDEVTNALRIGGAWARATEARWRGADYDAALLFAIPAGIDMDAMSCNTVAALLAGYYDKYGPIEDLAKIHPEVQFDQELPGGWRAQGKMDGLGSDKDGMSVIVEGKTTSDSLEPDSPYWDRLRFNIQLLQYVVAAHNEGWEIDRVIYDVCRKPQIKPKMITELDEDGLKIVLDAKGERVFKTVKKTGEQVPVQGGSESKGWVVQQHKETPEEFSDRLWKDTLARPDYYFVRKEVRILSDQIHKFIRHREIIIGIIEHLRKAERPTIWERDPEAWPRNIRKENCNFCIFRSFCLNGVSVNPHYPPHGFKITQFNPELEPVTTNEEEQTDETTS